MRRVGYNRARGVRRCAGSGAVFRFADDGVAAVLRAREQALLGEKVHAALHVHVLSGEG